MDNMEENNRAKRAILNGAPLNSVGGYHLLALTKSLYLYAWLTGVVKRLPAVLDLIRHLQEIEKLNF